MEEIKPTKPCGICEMPTVRTPQGEECPNGHVRLPDDTPLVDGSKLVERQQDGDNSA
jgi:hypothetical protein